MEKQNNKYDVEFFNLLTTEGLIITYGNKITDTEIKVKKFKELSENHNIYTAGLNWDLPNEVKNEKAKQIVNPIYRERILANWSGITEETKNICRGLKPGQTLEEKFLSLEKDEEIYIAILYWDVSNDAKSEAFKKLKDEKIIYNLLNDYKGIEYDINDVNKKFLDFKDPFYIIFLGKNKFISDESKNIKFLETNDESLAMEMYEKWDGLTQNNIEKKFLLLKEPEYIYRAGVNWKLTDEVKNKKFLSLWDKEKNCFYDEYYTFLCGTEWEGLTNKNKNEIFIKFKEEYVIQYAWMWWTGITEKSKKLQLERLKCLKRDQKCAYL